MSKFTTVKDNIPQKLSWPGFLASAKDSRTKVVLARKLEKQGLGSTPEQVKSGLFSAFNAQSSFVELDAPNIQP